MSLAGDRRMAAGVSHRGACCYNPQEAPAFEETHFRSFIPRWYAGDILAAGRYAVLKRHLLQSTKRRDGLCFTADTAWALLWHCDTRPDSAGQGTRCGGAPARALGTVAAWICRGFEGAQNPGPLCAGSARAGTPRLNSLTGKRGHVLSSSLLCPRDAAEKLHG